MSDGNQSKLPSGVDKDPVENNVVAEEVGSSSILAKKIDIVEIDQSDDERNDSENGESSGGDLGSGNKISYINRPPKPQRPFTEYNVFFQLEREYILQSMGAGFPSYAEEDEHDKDAQDRPPRYQHLILPTEWYRVGKAKARKQRRSQLASNKSGKITFLQLTKMISSSWANVDAETKKYCKSIALKELERYRRDMKSYIDKYGQPEKKRRRRKKTKNFTGFNCLNPFSNLNGMGLGGFNCMSGLSGFNVQNLDEINNELKKQSYMAMVMPEMMRQSISNTTRMPQKGQVYASLPNQNHSSLQNPSNMPSMSQFAGLYQGKKFDAHNSNKSQEEMFSLYESSVHEDAAANIDQQVDYFLKCMEHEQTYDQEQDQKREPQFDSSIDASSRSGDCGQLSPNIHTNQEGLARLPICRPASEGDVAPINALISNQNFNFENSTRMLYGPQFPEEELASIRQRGQRNDTLGSNGDYRHTFCFDSDFNNNSNIVDINNNVNNNSLLGQGSFQQLHRHSVPSSSFDIGQHSFDRRQSMPLLGRQQQPFDQAINASMERSADQMGRHEIYRHEFHRLAVAAAKAASARETLATSLSQLADDSDFKEW